MAVRAGGIVAVLGVDAAPFVRELERGARQAQAFSTRVTGDLKKMQPAISAAAGGFRKMTSPVLAATRALTGMAGPLGLVGGVGAGSFALAAKSAVDFADNLAKTADRLNVSTSALQEYQFAADRTGVAQDTLTDALSRLQKRAGQFATTGAGPAANALERLGLDADVAARRLGDTGALFDAAVRGLEAVESQAERSALAAELFGDTAGPRMLNLLDQGVDGIDRLREEARRLGVVLEEDALRQAEATSDALGELATVLDRNVKAALLSSAPLIEELADAMTDAIPAALGFADAVGEALGLWEQTSAERLAEINAELDQLRNPTGLGAVLAQFEVGLADRIDQLEIQKGAIEELLAYSYEPPAAVSPPASDQPDSGAIGAYSQTILEAQRQAEENARALQARAQAERQRAERRAVEEAAREARRHAREQARARERQLDDELRAREKAEEDHLRRVLEINRSANRESYELARDRTREEERAWRDVATTIEGAVAPSMRNLFRDIADGSANARDFVVDLVGSLAEAVLYKTVIDPLAGAIGDSIGRAFEFAGGGVMTAGGPLPLRRYERGGIAHSPQLALFGEGRRPEAYVPLPDGRRIPVRLDTEPGGSAGSIEQHFHLQGAVGVQALVAQLRREMGPAAVAAVTHAMSMGQMRAAES